MCACALAGKMNDRVRCLFRRSATAPILVTTRLQPGHNPVTTRSSPGHCLAAVWHRRLHASRFRIPKRCEACVSRLRAISRTEAPTDEDAEKRQPAPISNPLSCADHKQANFPGRSLRIQWRPSNSITTTTDASANKPQHETRYDPSAHQPSTHPHHTGGFSWNPTR